MAEAPHGWLRLCALADIDDGDARGFDPGGVGQDTLFAVRRGQAVHAYINSCPHNQVGLEFRRHRFLSHDGGQIMCYAHGARFDISSGRCTAGPCEGQSLTQVRVRVSAGSVIVEDKASEFSN